MIRLMRLIRHLGQFIFPVHDRDSIFSQTLDQQVRHPGLRILTTPAHR
jgi:hypothetical protein